MGTTLNYITVTLYICAIALVLGEGNTFGFLCMMAYGVFFMEALVSGTDERARQIKNKIR